jgi:hypothetical protein
VERIEASEGLLSVHPDGRLTNRSVGPGEWHINAFKVVSAVTDDSENVYHTTVTVIRLDC